MVIATRLIDQMSSIGRAIENTLMTLKCSFIPKRVASRVGSHELIHCFTINPLEVYLLY